MKKLTSLLAIMMLVFFVACNSENNIIDEQEQGTALTVPMSLELTGNVDKPVNVQMMAFKSDETTGIPVPQSLKNVGSTINVTCIFKSTDASQPVTKVVIPWTVTSEGVLELLPKTSFKMATGTDISKGTWYVCGVIGGVVSGTPSTNVTGIQFKRVAARAVPGANFDADIPYVFTWRRLTAHPTSNKLRSENPVSLSPLGTFSRLTVSNKTGFGIKYKGIRVITSNKTEGKLDLDNIVNSTLKDTPSNIESTDKSYASTFKIIQTAGKPKNCNLYYADYSFDEVQVQNGASDPAYTYIWMVPDVQKIEFTAPGGVQKTNYIEKAQVLLHAAPINPSDPSIDMLPVYGTRAFFTNGKSYSFKGVATFEYAPLHYVAKRDNFGTDDSYSSADDDISKTIAYDVEEYERNLSNIPAGYYAADRTKWATIFNNTFSFIGLAPFKYGTYQKAPTHRVLTPCNLKEKKTYVHSYAGAAFKDNYRGFNSITYMMGMEGVANRLTDKSLGATYLDYNTVPYTAASFAPVNYGSSFTVNDYPIATDNKYRYTIRWEDINFSRNDQSALKLRQRYLGEHFVLDLEDIANEKFWEPLDSDYPSDLTRIFPYKGCYAFNAGNGPFMPYKRLQGAMYYVNEPFDRTSDNIVGSATTDTSDSYASLTLRGNGGTDNYGYASGFKFPIRKGARPELRTGVNRGKIIVWESTVDFITMRAAVRLWKINPSNH